MSKTATIPMPLLEAYVALQRAVEDAMAPQENGADVDYLWPSTDEVTPIAKASLAISKLNNNEGKS